MAYGRCQLVDPAPGGAGVYAWETNYDTEDSFGSRRNVQRTATTNGVNVVRQQGDDEPIVIKVQGVILRKNQHQRFIDMFVAGKSRTLHFIDFEGHEYEVLLLAYLPTRQRTSRNPADPTILLHYYKYTMEMEVTRVISGPWVALTV